MGKAAKSDLKKARWLKLRESVLRRDGYQCQISRRYGKRIPAEVVHHIFPRNEFPEYTWEPWNLISLSHDAHNTLHDRTTGDLTDAGIDLLKKTARKMDLPVPLRYQ